MSAPTSKFSRLSLEAMTPTTRSKALASRASSSSPSSQHDSSDDSNSDSEDAPSSAVRSPSKLTYRIDHLPAESQAHIRDVFSDPPQLALQRCRFVNSTYAFQMTELVTRSVRVRAESEDDGPPLSCSCGENSDDRPCAHLLWLLDKIAEQTLYGPGRGSPLKMTAAGYAEEMDDPFRTIADHNLDVLGPGLHCSVVRGPNSQDTPDPHRILEARELLASARDEDVDSFRPDIFDNGDLQLGTRVLKRGDLDMTMTRMLLDNHHFFQYFLSAVSRSDLALRDPFRRLSQRADRILAALDQATEPAKEAPLSPTSHGLTAQQQQPQRDVPWAAKHIIGCTTLIRSLIYTRARPLSPSESLSAARSLVRILTLVTSHNTTLPSPSPTTSPTSRNLYLYLIGDQDRDFVIGILGLVPPAAASQFLSSLESALDDIGRHGAPAAYVERFRKLLERLRTSSVGMSVGTKRSGVATGQETSRGSKRMK